MNEEEIFVTSSSATKTPVYVTINIAQKSACHPDPEVFTFTRRWLWLYRPISLTPIISKILESFLYQWLLKSVADKIDPLQFESLKGSSTNMALVHLLHKWYEATDQAGSALRICLLDFSKAYDSIDHNILLSKLKRMEVHPVLINWVANF